MTILLIFTLFIYPQCGNAINVDEAIRMGLALNPGQNAVHTDTQLAQAVAQQTTSAMMPQVTLNENLLWTNEPGSSMFISLNQQRLKLSPDADTYNDPPARSDFETRLTLVQPVYDPDISYNIKRSRYQAEAGAALEQYSREQLGFAIFHAYMMVQRAQANLTWVDSSLHEAQQILQIAQVRQNSGIGIKADTLRAQVRLAETKRLKISADNALEMARRNLALQTGSANDQLNIGAQVDINSLLPLPDNDSVQRADLQALQLRTNAAQLETEQSRATWLPRLGLAASYSLHDRDYPLSGDADNWIVQAGLTWKMFDGFKRKYDTQGALAKQRGLTLRQQQAQREINFALQKSRLHLKEVQAQLDVSHSGAEAAAEGYRLLLERYDNGLSPLTDLLAAQTQLEFSRATLANNNIELLLALASVQQTNGTLLQVLLGKERIAE
jgi:outer membrane protein TolC